MAIAVGGDITEVTYNHPTIGQGSFFAKANEGNTIDIGGIRTSDDTSMIDGAGGLIVTKNRIRAGFEILCANDMNIRNDLSVAAELAASPVEADWTISHANGTVWSGTGTPVGDLSADMNAATFTLKVACSVLKKIVG